MGASCLSFWRPSVIIIEQAVYDDVEVTKLECGYLQKHLGPWLRSLKKWLGQSRLEDGKSTRDPGRLTKATIDKLQVYYGKAMRENTHNTESMNDAKMTIWHHTQSTDNNPEHNLCRPGEESWCGFQQDVTKGTSDYQHTHPFPKVAANTI